MDEQESITSEVLQRRDAIRTEMQRIIGWYKNDTDDLISRISVAQEDELVDYVQQLLAAQRKADTEKADRFEVIDDTGRAYVKGSIYGSPVSVELSYQDDGRTLKAFVSKRQPEQPTGDNHE